jgi:CsoR family transcriptional regulator, copper-sensing transcriptional repressor
MRTQVDYDTPRGYHTSMKKDKQALVRRLKIIGGQIRGLEEMLQKDTYCIDVITQTSAVKQALSGIENALMETHLATCVVDQVRQGKDKKAIEEILKVYELKRK